MEEQTINEQMKNVEKWWKFLKVLSSLFFINKNYLTDVQVLWNVVPFHAGIALEAYLESVAAIPGNMVPDVIQQFPSVWDFCVQQPWLGSLRTFHVCSLQESHPTKKNFSFIQHMSNQSVVRW